MNKNWWEYDLNDFTDEELWDHYATALRYMDWYYEYADDSRSWNRGKRSMAYLLSMKEYLESIDKERATKMYNEARPNG